MLYANLDYRTPYWMEKLNHRFANDGSFWMTYDDMLSEFEFIDRTRLFDKEWHIKQEWSLHPISWIHGYSREKFIIDIKTQGQVVTVLSQLDSRYFKGLQGQYWFRLHFILRKQGTKEPDFIVRANGSWRERSCSTEVELEPGRYEVIPKIVARRVSSWMMVEDVVKKYAESRPTKLQKIGLNHDIAYDKIYAVEEDNEEDEEEEKAEVEEKTCTCGAVKAVTKTEVEQATEKSESLETKEKDSSDMKSDDTVSSQNDTVEESVDSKTEDKTQQLEEKLENDKSEAQIDNAIEKFVIVDENPEVSGSKDQTTENETENKSLDKDNTSNSTDNKTQNDTTNGLEEKSTDDKLDISNTEKSTNENSADKSSQETKEASEQDEIKTDDKSSADEEETKSEKQDANPDVNESNDTSNIEDDLSPTDKTDKQQSVTGEDDSSEWEKVSETEKPESKPNDVQTTQCAKCHVTKDPVKPVKKKPVFCPRPGRPQGISQPEEKKTSKKDETSDDDVIVSPWNAACAIGLRIYSKDSNTELSLESTETDGDQDLPVVEPSA
jgi:hypothetical protein